MAHSTSTKDHEFDLVALGGGAAGLAAVRAAVGEGKRAAMVADGPIGGDCTWTGCVPSKTLIESAAAGKSFADAMADVHKTVQTIAETEDATALRSEGIEVFEGRGRLGGQGQIAVGGSIVRAGAIVLATGSHPVAPPIPGLGEVKYLTSESFWEMKQSPGRLGVLGGGPIGCELAQALARLGVDVTLFEAAPRLLGAEEPEVSDIILRALTNADVDVRLNATVTQVGAGPGNTIVVQQGQHETTVDELLVATGRRPNTADLGLERAGVALNGAGFIAVDKRLRTTAEAVWAAGDVNGLTALTHAADEQGRLAAWTALGRRGTWRFDATRVPAVTFTSPEVARVGVLEADAPRGARVAYLPMGENDRALAAQSTDGFIKLIAAPRRLLRNAGGGRIVGATIVGGRAGEMIHEPALAMLTNMFAGRLAQLGHAYPTWSVGIQKCAGQFFMEVEGRTARPVRR